MIHDDNDSQSHDRSGRGADAGTHDLRLLLAPPDRLCPTHWARAIRFAGAFGRASADYLGPAIRDGMEDGQLPFLRPATYLDMIVRPSKPEGLIAEDEVEAWRGAFEDGRADRDPRVQAFAAGLAERVAEITSSVLQRRRVLARYLEVPQRTLSLSGIVAGGIPVFTGSEGCFLVTDTDEAERLGSSKIRALCGRRGGSCVESCPFLDLLIHRSGN